jgi:hypothetical protein
LITGTKRKWLIGVTFVDVMLCVAYGVFAFMMRGMAHSPGSESFADLIGFVIFAYAIVGSSLLAFVLRNPEGRTPTTLLLVWNAVPLLGFSGLLPTIIQLFAGAHV